MGIQPDAVIPADAWPDNDDWDDDGPWCDHDTQLGQLARRLIGEMRDAAAELEGQPPAAREVGLWLRRRAQQAAIEFRQTGRPL